MQLSQPTYEPKNHSYATPRQVTHSIMQLKTTPFSHQRELYERTRELNRYALFWEQGTGKTKPTIDTAAWLHMQGKIDGLLVLAPNGVHRNWVSDEIPAHMPDCVSYSAHTYHSSKAGNKAHKDACKRLLEVPGLAVLAMSYDAAVTKDGSKLLEAFLAKRKCLYVLDEATRIKNPSAKRTKAVLLTARLAAYRRILTGTPIANGPFDCFAMLKFLKLDFWKDYCMESFFVFKHHFGIWKQGMAAGRQFSYVVGYRNLEQLHAILKDHSSRVTKDQVLDLPPKLYSKRYFQMNKEQVRVYNDLKDEFMTFLDGQLVTAPLVITRMMRLQQVTSGYVPFDGATAVQQLGEDNPRMKLLEEILEDMPHKAIIWAKFTKDIDLIMALVGNEGVRYDGSTSPDDRAKAIEAFQRGNAKYFVANPAAAGEGLTLTAARSTVYYNNSFKLTDRLQSEDRNHRYGTTHPVSYIDLVAEDTIDEHVVKSLVKKSDIARTILGDDIKKWI